MTAEPLFCTLNSIDIANFIRTAKRAVCYAGPGIQLEPAKALAEVAPRIGTGRIISCIDFDERVMRMGFGDVTAVKCLLEAGIAVNSLGGLRTALFIVDDEGFIFTPTALYLATEPSGDAPNAMRLSRQQVIETLARLSPTAPEIAQSQAVTHDKSTTAKAIAPAVKTDERNLFTASPVNLMMAPITEAKFAKVDANLKEAPPVKFDIARQVRVFEPYLQYVELKLTGAAIQRQRLRIPPSIQKLGGSKDIEGRLHTTFDLIEKSGKLSSKKLDDDLKEIRENFTPSLGKDYGRVVLKAAKPRLEERLAQFKLKLKEHQKSVAAELQKHLDDSRQQIIDYYLPRVLATPPDALLGQLLQDKPDKEDATWWLNAELERVFFSAEKLIEDMQLDVQFKDVTFETLNRSEFLDLIKEAFPNVDWERAYKEFKAAGEMKSGRVAQS